MPEILIYSVFALYLAVVVFTVIGLLKKRNHNQNYYKGFVTVLIAARNERTIIEKCINSVLSQDYPPDKFEVIVVDDNSDDGTAEILQRLGDKNDRMKILKTKDSIHLPPGKTKALATGLMEAKGEIIIQTDADCTASVNWLSTLLSAYSQNVVMVNGPTLPKASNIFSGLQALDFAFLHALAGGFAQMDIPLAGMGNNMSFRKKDYDKTGGFEKIDFSVTEDFALSAQFRKTGKSIVHVTNEESLIETAPLTKLSELFNQKKRWVAGGAKGGVLFYFLFGTAAASNLLILILAIIKPENLLSAATLKAAADFWLLVIFLGQVKKLQYLRYFLIYELYLMFYILFFPILLLFSRNIFWKGRSFS